MRLSKPLLQLPIRFDAEKLIFEYYDLDQPEPDWLAGLSAA
jgi:hypothetical protein